jgi:hypothetical protein
MTRVLSAAALLVCGLIALPLQALVFDYEQIGGTVVTDCPSGFPPQPLCSLIDANGEGNDVPDAIPGHWLVHLQGQVLFFVGAGTFSFDDPTPSDNDFFGTWSNVLFPPNALGVAHSIFHWSVTGGSGIFAGRGGAGTSEGDVVIAPFAFDQNGVPQFVAACDGGTPGLGSYCDRGQFVIAEPAVLGLLALAFAAAAAGRARVMRQPRAR